MASSTEQASAQAEPSLTGRYRITSSIESNAIAEVSRAIDATSGTEVALKVFTTGTTTRLETRERLVRAIESLAALTHPHILSPMCVDQHDGHVAYPMRLARGGSLEARLRLRTRVPTDRIVAIVKEAAAALDHLHGHGLVHGGLKPSNVLFDEDGRTLIADAGVERALFPARAVYPPGARHAQAYHAPELRLQRAIDGRADQYSLAVIAYELLSGQRRVDAPMIEGIQTVDPLEVPAEEPLRRDAGLHINTALRRALSANPGARFGSAVAFADAIAGEASSETVPKKAKSRRSFGAKRYALPIGLAAVAAACVLLLNGSAGRERVARARQAARVLFATSIPRVRVDVASGSIALQAPPPRSPPIRLPTSSGLLAVGSARSSGSSTGHSSGSPSGNAGRGVQNDSQGTTGGGTILRPLGGFLTPSSGAPAVPADRRSASTATGTPLPAPSTPGDEPSPSLFSRVARLFGFNSPSVNADGSGSRSRPDRASETIVPVSVPSPGGLNPSSDSLGLLSTPPGAGYLKVTVDNGIALVIIDGVPRGPTPLVVGLGTGTHTVSTRSLDGSYLPSRTTVTISNADTAVASFLKASAAPLR